jgi:predicted nucleic acid-binding protein
MTVWWSTPIECLSAISRAERDGRISAVEGDDAVAAFRLLRTGWSEVDATSRLREIAERIARTQPLRAADACQLAAAITAAEGAPATLPFITLDARLAAAANREGFEVIGVAAP